MEFLVIIFVILISAMTCLIFVLSFTVGITILILSNIKKLILFIFYKVKKTKIIRNVKRQSIKRARRAREMKIIFKELDDEGI